MLASSPNEDRNPATVSVEAKLLTSLAVRLASVMCWLMRAPTQDRKRGPDHWHHVKVCRPDVLRPARCGGGRVQAKIRRRCVARNRSC